MQVRTPKPSKGMQMEGAVARWYTRIRGTGSQVEGWRRDAARFVEGLPTGADVLEVAPGPGYLAIELARLGVVRVTGLDSSHTFVEIAGRQAELAGVTVAFEQGDAAAMPFAADSFDLIVCQAAFKNFSRPLEAINEMHRVLRPGATAIIEDMSGDASRGDIAREVQGMELGGLNAFTTRFTLRQLRRRAYSETELRGLISESAFATGAISSGGISLEVRLTKAPAGP
jgi:ubiquinone/menaquinone biosynthesis C-methylase UbiE